MFNVYFGIEVKLELIGYIENLKYLRVKTIGGQTNIIWER